MDLATLNKVVEYCTHHKDDAVGEDGEVVGKKSDEIDEWDAEFCKVDQDELLALILVRFLVFFI